MEKEPITKELKIVFCKGCGLTLRNYSNNMLNAHAQICHSKGFAVGVYVLDRIESYDEKVKY